MKSGYVNQDVEARRSDLLVGVNSDEKWYYFNKGSRNQNHGHLGKILSIPFLTQDMKNKTYRKNLALNQQLQSNIETSKHNHEQSGGSGQNESVYSDGAKQRS